MSLQISSSAVHSKLVKDKLVKWEEANQLEDEQKDYILQLASWASENSEIDLPSADVAKSLEADHSDSIQNAQQFYEWFHLVEKTMKSHQESGYRDYITVLKEHFTRCNSIITGINTSLEYLENLTNQYRTVSHTTEALHDSCEMLMQEQTNLEDIRNNISQQLIYFTEHENIGTKLNSSSLNVMGEAFIPMMLKIDECVEFMKEHPHYKESEVYLAKYQQCLARALTILRSYVVSTIKSCCANLPMPAVPIPSDPIFAQLYSKFQLQGPKVKTLMQQIEENSSKNVEYLQVMQDCYTCYCYQRQTLLMPSITNEIDRLYKLHSNDHCTFIRLSCMMLIRICEDEHALYHCFFSQYDIRLQGLLENISSQLYDYFRPMIIKQLHLESLADMCSVIKNDIIEDQVKRKGSCLEAFGLLALQMLEDAQERLSFRTQAFIQSDIVSFAPVAGDLAYPEKLSQNLSNEYGMWYPTVKRTLICLSKLYRCTNKQVFESLAQESLSACIESLKSASKSIEESKSSLDAQLFLIKHLLILREQIAPFNVNFSVSEVCMF